MSTTWERRHEALKAIHDKLEEILAKLDDLIDPQVTDVEGQARASLRDISVANLGQIVNGDFELFESFWATAGKFYRLIGWVDKAGNSVRISDDIGAFSGFYCASLKYSSAGGIFQAISPPIPTRYIKSFSIMTINQDWVFYSSHDIYIDLTYSDGTSTTQTITIPWLQTWTKVDLTYSANKFIVGIKIRAASSVSQHDLIAIDALNLNYESPIQIRGTAEPVTAVIDTTGDNTIYTPASGKRLYVKKIQISNRSSNLEPRISFKFGTTGDEHFPITLAGYGTEVIDLVGMNWKGGVDEPLIAVRDAVSATVDCTILKEEAEL